MPLVTYFSVLERPGKNRKGGCNNPLGQTRVKLDVKNQHANITTLLIVSIDNFFQQKPGEDVTCPMPF